MSHPRSLFVGRVERSGTRVGAPSPRYFRNEKNWTRVPKNTGNDTRLHAAHAV